MCVMIILPQEIENSQCDAISVFSAGFANSVEGGIRIYTQPPTILHKRKAADWILIVTCRDTAFHQMRDQSLGLQNREEACVPFPYVNRTAQRNIMHRYRIIVG